MDTVARSIRSHADEIVAIWDELARESRNARELSRAQRLDVMPALVASFADADDAARSRRFALVTAHVSIRLRQGFDLAEIADELAMVGRAASRVWAGVDASERPHPMDVEGFYEELQRAMRHAADVFTQHMRDNEQREKRLARKLEAAAEQALTTMQLPCCVTSVAVLSVLEEATRADAVVVVVRDAERGTLLDVAAVGTPHHIEEAKRFALAYAPTEPGGIGDLVVSSDVSSLLRASSAELRRGVVTTMPPADGRITRVFVVSVDESALGQDKVRCLETLVERLSVREHDARLYGQLQQSVAELKSEQNLREHMGSMIAHDLRGTLAVAHMSAQLLEHAANVGESARVLATRIDRSLRRAERMIRDMLDATRLRAGQHLPIVVQAADLRAIADDVLVEAVAVYGDRFQLRAEGDLHGYWSSDELRRALWNLVTNAVKYGAYGRPITIIVRRVSTDRVEAAVHNEGPPVPREEHAKFFEAFVRAPNVSRTTTGWGLGLTLVRGCAEAHGGTVRFDSAAGSGTTVAMDLPIDARPVAERDASGTFLSATPSSAPVATQPSPRLESLAREASDVPSSGVAARAHTR